MKPRARRRSDELDRERIRLWYVAATRARELLVLPRLDATPSKSAWISLLDLSLADLPGLRRLPTSAQANRLLAPARAMPRHGTSSRPRPPPSPPGRRALPGLRPAATKAPLARISGAKRPTIWNGAGDDQAHEIETTVAVQGGRERGLILHKLMEEVLTGETGDDMATLEQRAGDLIRALGRLPVADPATGLSAQELAGCVARTLALTGDRDIAAGASGRVPRLRRQCGRR